MIEVETLIIFCNLLISLIYIYNRDRDQDKKVQYYRAFSEPLIKRVNFVSVPFAFYNDFELFVLLFIEVS